MAFSYRSYSFLSYKQAVCWNRKWRSYIAGFGCLDKLLIHQQLWIDVFGLIFAWIKIEYYSAYQCRILTNINQTQILLFEIVDDIVDEKE
jgi:hypothetical protein